MTNLLGKNWVAPRNEAGKMLGWNAAGTAMQNYAAPAGTNIKDLGATGNGVTDDTAAFNTAIAGINAGTIDELYIAPGTYLISSALTVITASGWTIRGAGQGASTIKISAAAGTLGTFFQIGNSTTQRTDWQITGLTLECLNTATLNGTGNAINCYASVRGKIDNIRAVNVNGLVTLGNTAGVAVSNQTKITRCETTSYAPAGGIAVDIQSSAGHFLAFCNFGATGTAAASFRGLKFHPATTDVSDAGKFTLCAWNYVGPDPAYNMELDATNNHISSQQFVGCVIDQALTANIWMHIDSGAATEAHFASIEFTGCISNGSTGANSILLDNTGNKAFSVHWNGGQVSSTGNNAAVRLQGGNRIDANFLGVDLLRRSTGGSSNGAFIVAAGVSGLSVADCLVYTRLLEGAGTPFLPYDNLVHFEGASSNCRIEGNIADRCLTDVIGGTEPTASIIRRNINSKGPMPFRRADLLGGRDSVNAIENGDFERGDFGWNKGTGWAINNDSANAETGYYVAKSTDVSGTARAITSDTRTACAPNDVIYAVARFKTDVGMTMTVCRVQINWYDKDGAVLSQTSGTNFTTDQTSYTSSPVTGTAPASAAAFSVRFLITKTVGNVYVDNITAHLKRDAARLVSDGTVTTTQLGGDITTAGKALMDDADAAAQRTTLGLGTAATQNTGTSGATIPLLNGNNVHSGNIGFFGTAAGAKPTVTGSRGGNAALASLLTGLAGLGLLTDSSTA